MLTTGAVLDGVDVLERVLALPVAPHARRRLLCDQARLFIRAEKNAEAGRHAELALSLAEAAGDAAVVGHAQAQLSVIACFQGKIQDGRDRATRALEILSMDRPRRGVFTALRSLALCLQVDGDHAGARANYTRALTLARRWAFVFEEPLAHFHLGGLARAAGEVEVSADHYRAALRGAARTGQRVLEARLHTSVGLAEDDRGDHEAAVRHYRASMELCRELGRTAHGALAAGNLGDLLVRMGRLDEGATPPPTGHRGRRADLAPRRGGVPRQPGRVGVRARALRRGDGDARPVREGAAGHAPRGVPRGRGDAGPAGPRGGRGRAGRGGDPRRWGPGEAARPAGSAGALATTGTGGARSPHRRRPRVR